MNQNHDLVDGAVALARDLQSEIQTQTHDPRNVQVSRLIEQPGELALMTSWLDQGFRSSGAARAYDQLRYLLLRFGIPQFAGATGAVLMTLFRWFGGLFPWLSVFAVRQRLRADTAHVVWNAEPEPLRTSLRGRRMEDVRVNLNLLGEAVLGEEECSRRFEKYLSALSMDEVECISVKATTIYSQIRPISRDHAVNVLGDRFARLFARSSELRFRRPDGSSVPKFVYVDMENYADVEVTVRAFKRALGQESLLSVSAGLALQAYIPDAFRFQRELTEWSMSRRRRGGAPITVRLVKGANMEMERVDASIAGWAVAPFEEKSLTDANFKRMLDYGLHPEHVDAVRIGVGSHNLFDLCYASLLAKRRGVVQRMQFEALEGMLLAQQRLLSAHVDQQWMYAPATEPSSFVHAVGYLTRRLDENTAPDNFLRHAFSLRVDSPEWTKLERDFRKSFDRLDGLADESRRDQRRGSERHEPLRLESVDDFRSAPDTDFSVSTNVDWIGDHLRRRRAQARPVEVPVCVAGHDEGGVGILQSTDPSEPGVMWAEVGLASKAQVKRALRCAREDLTRWAARPVRSRQALLAEAAANVGNRRGDLLTAMVAEGGKIVTEADPEVSEAVDFIHWYGVHAAHYEQLAGVQSEAKGVVTVVTPWNFPLAIPAGGIAAALSTGNPVVFKPADETPWVAHLLCQAFWDAGVPKEALQYVPCTGAARDLLTDPGASDVVVFTGGTVTADHLLDRNPRLPLLAETGGKNALIVTAMADRELAVKHAVQSAFGHAGQKCSATSLLILEREVYEDRSFRDMLRDAAASLPVGPAWDLKTVVGPLIREPSGALARGLSELDAGESWLLEPTARAGNPQLFSPGIRWGTRAGQFTYEHELFGPVLSVLCAKDLDHALDLANGTDFGLTAGLHSLDEREQERWQAAMCAGNLYINRTTTGAIVGRQPFGGMKNSARGAGLKAGGAAYVTQFRRWLASEPRAARAEELLAHYRDVWNRCFRDSVDAFDLVGQSNHVRHVPFARVVVMLSAQDSDFELLGMVLGARVAARSVWVCADDEDTRRRIDGLVSVLTDMHPGVQAQVVSESELVTWVEGGRVDRVRSHRFVWSEGALRAFVQANVHVCDGAPCGHGEIDLLAYVHEQAISFDYHRYGYLGDRARGGAGVRTKMSHGG